MKSICLPVGIGLPMGAVTGMRVGRWANWAATLSAAALLEAPPPLEAPVLDDELLPPHALSATAAIASRAARAATRAGSLRCPELDVIWDSPPFEGCVGVLDPAGAGQSAAAARARSRPGTRTRPEVTARATISTTPVKTLVDHCGVDASDRPVVPVPSRSTAITVPHALKRPPRSCVAPRKAAAYAASRYGSPAGGEPDPIAEVKTTPATPASSADVMSERNRSRFVATFWRRAASGLQPVAHTRRPVGVCSGTSETAPAITSR